MILKELFARLGLDIDEGGFNKADNLVGGLKGGLVALGAIAAAAGAGLAAMVMQTVEAADSIDETAQSVGIGTDALQELGYAASFSGMNIESVAHGLTILVRNMKSAADGSKETAAAFAKVGVSIQDANGELRPAEDVLMDLADAIGSMPDSAEKTALSMKFFGKSGAGMIPFLNAGREGIQELRNEAHELGLVLSEDTVKAGAEADDAMTKLKASLTGLQYSISGPLVSSLKDAAVTVFGWVKANRELVKQRVDKVVNILKVGAKGLLLVLNATWVVLGFLIDHWKLLAFILSSVVMAALVMNAGALWAIATANAAAGAAGVKAAMQTAAAWVLANAPLIALTGLFLLFFLMIEDVSTALEGGDSLLKTWLGDWKDDNPNDPWWLRAFKSLVYGILHFDEIWSFWKGQFNEFWDWLVDGFNLTADKIVKKFKGFFGFGGGDSPSSFGEGGFRSDDGRGPGAWRRVGEDGELRFFPAPTATRGAGGVSSEFKAEFNITAGPNQSPGEIANEARSQFDEWHQNQLEAAYSAVE